MWNFGFISLFSLLVQTKSIYHTTPIKLEENQSFQGLFNSKIVFQSNQSQFSQIDSIDFQIIKQVFTIEQFDYGKMINLVFLSTFNFQKEIVFCVCQLMKSNTSYFIMCIDGIKNFKNEFEFKLIKNAKKYYIDLQTEFYEMCEKLFIDSQNQLIVYCYTLNQLKIHRINLQQQTTILLQQSQQINMIDCKYKFIHIDQITILAIYNCQEWKLLKIAENKLETILNSQILYETLSINLLQIQYLTEIYNCQNQFYLIEQENYLVIKFFENKFSYQNEFNGNYEIFLIQFSLICQVDYMILLDNSQSAQEIKFDERKRQIIINKQFQFDIYGLDQFVFLRNNNCLNVIICQFLNQTFEIEPSKLYFIDNQIKYENINIQVPQLFYQIDKHQQKANFYQYFNLPKIIKPTKKYLFSLEYFDIFVNQDYQEIIIQEVIYETKQLNQIYSHKVSVINDCQNITSLLFNKNLLDLPQNYDILFYEQQNEQILNIFDEIDYFQILPYMKEKRIEKILYTGNIDKTGVTPIIYIYQDILYFYNSQQNLIVYQKFIDKSMVFHTFGLIVAIYFQLKKMQVIVPTTYETIERTEYFNQSINTVTLSDNYLIILFIDQSFLIYNVPIMKNEYLEDNIIQLGIPLYYTTKTSIYYQKIQKNCRIRKILIYSTLQNNQEIYIQSIHKIEDKLIIFYFDGNQLIVIDEFIVNNTKFLRPLQFQYENDFISIPSITNQTKCICTFFVKDFIKLINIKLCHNHNFTLSQDFLIYFNLNNQLKLFNLNYINITLKNPEQQSNYYDQHLIKLQIRYEYKNQLLQTHKTLQILLFNFCYQIYPKQKSLKVTDKSQIQSETLFLGPISEISIQNEVVSPFRNQQIIMDCSKLINQTCFVIYKILKSTEDYFKLYYIPELKYYLVQQNHEAKLKLIKYGLINNSSQLINIFTDNEIIYLHQFKIEHQSRQLIELNLTMVIKINSFLLLFEIKSRDSLILINIKEFLKDIKILIHFQEQNYIIYNITQDQKIIDIFQISNDLYLKLYHSQNNEFFELFSFVNQKIVVKICFIVQHSEFESNLEQISKYYQDFQQFKKTITNCTLIDDILEINVFLISNEFSSEIKITYNIQNGEIQQKLLKIIRSPYKSQSTNLNYLDSQFLILESSEANHFLYDLRRNQTLIDHFTQLKFNTNLFNINTTHYIISIQDNYYIGEIGYEVEFLENSEQSFEKIIIVAQNSVSSAELEIEISKGLEKKDVSSIIQYLVLLIFVLLFLIFFLRRKSLKLKLRRRQRDKTSNKDSYI